MMLQAFASSSRSGWTGEGLRAAGRYAGRRRDAKVARTFATAATATSEPTVNPPSRFTPPAGPLTGQAASSYLSDLLSLPAGRAFPPKTALQILTHKSYPAVQPLSSPHPADPTSAQHNHKLAFIGRRTLALYLAMFVHRATLETGGVALEELDFLRGRTLDEKIAALSHPLNLGRELGEKWGVGQYMRWDGKAHPLSSSATKIQGHTIHSIIGATFSQFGSPAAHRTFHTLVLPGLENQLRDPRLIDLSRAIAEEARSVALQT